MIKRFLSRYHYRYPKSLVYMLQVSEYSIVDFLIWYSKVSDFSQVEKRQFLVKTSKAVLLITVSWTIYLLVIGRVCFFLITLESNWKYFYSLLSLLLLPEILFLSLVVFVTLVKVLFQTPLEYLIVLMARKKLRKHRAIKIAIAGSFGKTTMREILKTVLGEGKKVTCPPANYNTPLGISRFIRQLTGNEEVLIFELGEYYPGDIEKLCKLTLPDFGVITGVNEAHLSKFKTLTKTVKTIFELTDYVAPDKLYVNGESLLALNNSDQNNIIYKLQSVGEWQITNQKTDLTGTSFSLVKNIKHIDLKSSLLGLHQIGPLATACEIAFKLGLSSEQVQVGISKVNPFEHRLEMKTNNEGVVILDDSYNGNPDGIKAVIDFLASLKGVKKFYITPGLVEMGPATKEVHLKIGKLLAEANIEKVLLIKNSVTGFIEEGLVEAGFHGDIIWFEDTLKALSAISSLTIPGDVVILQNDWPDQYQ